MTITLGRQVGALASTLAITALGLTLAAPATAADAVSSRIGGADRWETSALISKETFATGVDDKDRLSILMDALPNLGTGQRTTLLSLSAARWTAIRAEAARVLDTYERAIDGHVKNLRRKLEPDPAHPRYLLTVHGVGYRFADA